MNTIIIEMKKVLAMVALAVATLPVMAQQTKYSIKGTAPAGRWYIWETVIHVRCWTVLL